MSISGNGVESLVIGACDGRRLAQGLARAGVPSETYTPESCFELLATNDRIAELHAELDSHGFENFIKTEPVPLRQRIEGKNHVVIFPFYENKPIYRDRETGCCFYLRIKENSYYFRLLKPYLKTRFERIDLNRETYYERLAEGLLKLAHEFPQVAFVLLLPGYDSEVFGPDYVYNVPYVSDTFEHFEAMTQRGRAYLPAAVSRASNIRSIEIDPVFQRLLTDRRLRNREIFSFLVPRKDRREGYHRDIAHISDLALTFLAHHIAGRPLASLVPGAWLDEERYRFYEREPFSVDTVRAKLRAGQPDLWSNAIEDAIVSQQTDRVSPDVTETFVEFLADSSREPSTLLMFFSYFTYLSNSGVTSCPPEAFDSIMAYFFSKDLEYGAWKDFFQLSAGGCSRLMSMPTVRSPEHIEVST
jgi:hypothetical protein